MAIQKLSAKLQSGIITGAVIGPHMPKGIASLLTDAMKYSKEMELQNNNVDLVKTHTAEELERLSKIKIV